MKTISTLLEYYLIKQWVCLDISLGLVNTVYNSLLMTTIKPKVWLYEVL